MLEKRDGCREKLKEGMVRVAQGREILEGWKLSRTKMIKKVRYPTVEEVRPIALLDVSQKLYLTFF